MVQNVPGGLFRNLEKHTKKQNIKSPRLHDRRVGIKKQVNQTL